MLLKNVIKFVLLISLTLFTVSGFASTKMGESSMDDKKTCQLSLLEKSHAQFQKILDDLIESYDHLGGEITSIKSIATNVYVVSIAQEERVDLITYELEQNDDCSITIKSQKIDVKSNW